ncbi:MAG: glycine cleavage system aminomethyltransferase GcvT [Planctomycetes bacterium]|nr:glycine cleavage system aminomethyltransferase GcvT [Planctomycetota bacterium]
MGELNRTLFYDRHVALGAKMVEFGGWEMPVQYAGGIIQEHTATRKHAGLFDVSHMGRFILGGAGATAFLQHVLTNNAAALEPGQAQYTIIPDEQGGAIDDAYLYRFIEDEYLLVVNASNRRKDWDHFQQQIKNFRDVQLTDRTRESMMLSLQGPDSKKLLAPLIQSGSLGQPRRNALSVVTIAGAKVLLARTGYTGEPLCFELFIEAADALKIFDLLIAAGAVPVGLGARDTLRLEAGLPLYGHELGTDPDGKEIPIFACPLAKFAVSFSPIKDEFIGKVPLKKQHEAFRRFMLGDYSHIADLPRVVMPLALVGKSVARASAKVFAGDKHVGYVTSGTMVPYWQSRGQGLGQQFTDATALRAICLALLNSDTLPGKPLVVEVRGNRVEAQVVQYHLRSEAPPYAHPVLLEQQRQAVLVGATPGVQQVHDLLAGAIENTIWRQQECMNLIPSEMTISPMARLLSIMDPSFRYAEHKAVKAFGDAEVFYYQGTDFICRVEQLLTEQLRLYFGCADVETRAISGQMANTVVFSAIVDYLNRGNRKAEPRRIAGVMNNDIFKGGHLSAQPMGALKDFLARDSRTEAPAAVNFPVLPENPYKIDVVACKKLIDQHKPELIIFGRSAVLHTEPVAEIRRFVEQIGLRTFIMYDMAHVLGLVGPHFQEPFREGADVVTGSTHKTFFGTQRGVVAGNCSNNDRLREFWEAIQRRTFPGAVSNHHLGTLLGLLMAAYEMNHFKDAYQKAVIANAKAFARAMRDAGLNVAGDSSVDFTQTHQVIVEVGYAAGPEIAARLERNNIIVNYQAGPHEEGFSAAGAIRMGVAEMTRFGMKQANFQTLAGLMAETILKNKKTGDEVKAFRQKFQQLQFCFAGKEFEDEISNLHSLI